MLPGFAVAVWLVGRRPDHVQARRLLLAGAAGAADSGIDSVIQLAYRGSADDSWLAGAIFVEQTVGMVYLAATCSLLGSYPDGTVEKRWQRGVLRALWLQIAFPLLLLLLTSPVLVIHPVTLAKVPRVPSPVAVEWLAPLGPPLATAFLGYYGALIALAVLFVRFLQVGAEQRRRMRPLVYGIAFGVPVLLADNALRAAGLAPDSGWFVLTGTLYIPLALVLPVSLVLGVLRHRLFDIDLVIRRSVVYGVLTIGIAAVYIALAAAPGLALGQQIPVELAVVATILAAVAFQPLRRRLEVLADRWVFGARVSRYELLTAFGASLEQAIDLRELLPRLADTGVAELTVPLDRRGEAVGRIECGRKNGGYDADDVELLTTLARQAATAIANVELTARLAEQVDEPARSRAGS